MDQFNTDNLKAQEAAALLGNPLFKEAFSGVREAIIRQMEQDLAASSEVTEKRLSLLRALPLVREYLENYMYTGKINAQTQEEI